MKKHRERERERLPVVFHRRLSVRWIDSSYSFSLRGTPRKSSIAFYIGISQSRYLCKVILLGIVSLRACTYHLDFFTGMWNLPRTWSHRARRYIQIKRMQTEPRKHREDSHARTAFVSRNRKRFVASSLRWERRNIRRNRWFRLHESARGATSAFYTPQIGFARLFTRVSAIFKCFAVWALSREWFLPFMQSSRLVIFFFSTV